MATGSALGAAFNDALQGDAFPLLCGSNQYNMGMGRLGLATTEPKRKFRWVMGIRYCGNRFVPAHYCKTSARPDMSVEETELNFLNSKMWITGKPAWEAISVTYIDVATDENIELWSWIGTIYNFFTPPGRNQPCYSMGKRIQYEGTALLQLLDACGYPTEQWTMKNMFPTSIKFGDLDYTASETVDIELQLRYANVEFENFCGAQPNPCPCEPCSVGQANIPTAGSAGPQQQFNDLNIPIPQP